jgi:hypothetical protein
MCCGIGGVPGVSGPMMCTDSTTGTLPALPTSSPLPQGLPAQQPTNVPPVLNHTAQYNPALYYGVQPANYYPYGYYYPNPYYPASYQPTYNPYMAWPNAYPNYYGYGQQRPY